MIVEGYVLTVCILALTAFFPFYLQHFANDAKNTWLIS